MEAETGVMQLRAKECLGCQQRKEAEKYSPLEPVEGALLISRVWNQGVGLQTLREWINFCCFKSLKFFNLFWQPLGTPLVLNHPVPTRYLLVWTFIYYQVWFSWDHWITGPHSLAWMIKWKTHPAEPFKTTLRCLAHEGWLISVEGIVYFHLPVPMQWVWNYFRKAGL